MHHRPQHGCYLQSLNIIVVWLLVAPAANGGGTSAFLNDPKSIFYGPAPRTYFSLTSPALKHVRLTACYDPQPSDDPILPVMVMIANPTQTAWTVDASQISAWTVDASKILPAENAQELELPIPHEEAARMSPMPWFDGVDEVIDRAGVFATYGAGIGAAGGAIAAEAKGEGIDNGFQLGAGYGGVVGLVAGAIVEDLRISLSRETKEAGDANEKMKFLALKDKSILYSGYVTLGYVYFVQPTKELKSVRILLTRGDPSKDWTIAPSNELFQTSDYCSNASHSNEECCKKRELCKRIPKNERWPEFDLSPVVCECPVDLHRCNTSQNQVACHALGGGRSDSGSCRDIVNLQGVVKGEPSTTISWPKWH